MLILWRGGGGGWGGHSRDGLVTPNHLTVYAVGSEVIDQVLHHVHLVGGDVVEGDGAVTAAGHALLHRVEDVLLVPEIIRHVSRYQVVLRNEREEAAAPQRVSE